MRMMNTLLRCLLVVAVCVGIAWAPIQSMAAAGASEQPSEAQQPAVSPESLILPPDSAASEEAAATASAQQDASAPSAQEAQYPDFDDSVLNDTMTAVLMDSDTGEVLFQRKADERIYPASTTKIMTGLLCIELNGGNLDGEITVGQEVDAFSKSSSLLGLRSNSTVSIQDLMYGLMLVSGNDAAAALAVHFGGSEEGFVNLMNQKAQELEMTNTHFGNPHGLEQSSIGVQHFSSASDMAKLARAATQNEVLMTIMGTSTYEITSTELNPSIRPVPELHNGNYLLDTPPQEPQHSRYAQFKYDGTTGMKTGLLANVEGYKYYGCLVASASRDGRNLIACVFADTSDYGTEGPALDRWKAAIAMFEYGFNMVVDVDIAPYVPDFSTDVRVSGYAVNDPYDGSLTVTVQADAEMPSTLALPRSLASELQQGAAQIEAVPDITAELTAPITAGQEMGSVSYMIDGTSYFTAPLVASRSIYVEGDEDVTSAHYNVPNPSDFPWWMWIVIGGAGVGVFFLVYFLVQRRRYSARHIGKSRRGSAYYNSYMRSWNDDVPLSALRKQRDAKKKADYTSHFKKW